MCKLYFFFPFPPNLLIWPGCFVFHTQLRSLQSPPAALDYTCPIQRCRASTACHPSLPQSPSGVCLETCQTSWGCHLLALALATRLVCCPRLCGWKTMLPGLGLSLEYSGGSCGPPTAQWVHAELSIGVYQRWGGSTRLLLLCLLPVHLNRKNGIACFCFYLRANILFCRRIAKKGMCQ